MLINYTACMLQAMGYGNAKISVLYSLVTALENYIISVAKDSKHFHPSKFKRPNYFHFIRILTKNGLVMSDLLEYCVLINLKKYKCDDFYVKEEGGYTETTTVQEFLETMDLQAMSVKGVSKIFTVGPIGSSTRRRKRTSKCKTLVV